MITKFNSNTTASLCASYKSVSSYKCVYRRIHKGWSSHVSDYTHTHTHTLTIDSHTSLLSPSLLATAVGKGFNIHRPACYANTYLHFSGLSCPSLVTRTTPLGSPPTSVCTGEYNIKPIKDDLHLSVTRHTFFSLQNFNANCIVAGRVAKTNGEFLPHTYRHKIQHADIVSRGKHKHKQKKKKRKENWLLWYKKEKWLLGFRESTQTRFKDIRGGAIDKICW